MPKICYVSKRFNRSSQETIAWVASVLDEYSAKGFELTVRQIFYQGVSRGYIPNTVKSYNRLGSIVSDARLAGLIDWNHIEDRTRNLKGRQSWRSPASILDGVAYSYHLDRWKNQDTRIEVFCEKEALIGIFAEVCNRWDLPYFACRGYVSQSEAWRAAMRVGQRTKPTLILHFGDHDPSGIDMTRDIRDRFEMFRVPTEVHRLALNMDQIEEFNPPPNPAKSSDSRFQAYVMEYGDESWELDALEPEVLIGLVEKTVLEYRDEDKWAEVVDREIEDRASLQVLSENWSEVKEGIESDYGTDVAQDSLREDYEEELNA